eukprot:scaffold6179_cov119-Isochrysis_galbana.AAC.5
MRLQEGGGGGCSGGEGKRKGGRSEGGGGGRVVGWAQRARAEKEETAERAAAAARAAGMECLVGTEARAAATASMVVRPRLLGRRAGKDEGGGGRGARRPTLDRQWPRTC